MTDGGGSLLEGRFEIMSETKIVTRLSKLALLLQEAAEHGFDRVIIDKQDWGITVGVGFVDKDGNRHTVRFRPGEDLLSFVKKI